MRLWMAASLIVCILAAGIFMEYQMGNGFLKLSCLCSACLGIRFFNLFLVIYRRKYEMVEGEVVRIQICGKRKRYWEITIKDQYGNEKMISVSEQSNMRKGMCYRIYLKDDTVFCIEKQDTWFEA